MALHTSYYASFCAAYSHARLQFYADFADDSFHTRHSQAHMHADDFLHGRRRFRPMLLYLRIDDTTRADIFRDIAEAECENYLSRCATSSARTALMAFSHSTLCVLYGAGHGSMQQQCQGSLHLPHFSINTWSRCRNAAEAAPKCVAAKLLLLRSIGHSLRDMRHS